MKKIVLAFSAGIGVLSMAATIGYAAWTTRKSTNPSVLQGVSYTLVYHFTDYANGGIAKTETITGLQKDAHIEMKDLAGTGHLFYGWSPKSNPTSATRAGLEHTSVRTLLADIAEAGLSPSTNSSGSTTIYTIDLYAYWTTSAMDIFTIKAVSAANSGNVLYSFSFETRARMPVFQLASLDPNLSTLSYYSYSSNVKHFDSKGTSVTTNRFNLNDTILLDQFGNASEITLTAIYSS